MKTCLELFGRRSVRDSKERVASALIKYLMQPYVIIRNPLDLSPKQWYFKIEGRKLRDQFPQVSVKSIETHTSKIWEAMSPTDKEVSFAKKSIHEFFSLYNVFTGVGESECTAIVE